LLWWRIVNAVLGIAVGYPFDVVLLCKMLNGNHPIS